MRESKIIYLKLLIRTQCYNYNAYVINVIPELEYSTNMQTVSFDIDMSDIFLYGEFVKQIYQSLKTMLSNNFEDFYIGQYSRLFQSIFAFGAQLIARYV